MGPLLMALGTVASMSASKVSKPVSLTISSTSCFVPLLWRGANLHGQEKRLVWFTVPSKLLSSVLHRPSSFALLHYGTALMSCNIMRKESTTAWYLLQHLLNHATWQCSPDKGSDRWVGDIHIAWLQGLHAYVPCNHWLETSLVVYQRLSKCTCNDKKICCCTM